MDEKYILCEQIIRLLDGAVSEDEFRSFERSLHEKPEMLQLYLSVVKAHAYMQKPGHLLRNNMASERRENEIDDLVWQLLAKDEKESPSIPQPRTKEETTEISTQRETVACTPRLKNKTSVFSLIFSIAAILLLVVFVRFAPVRGGSFGQITDQYQAVLQDSKSGVFKGLNLCSEPLKLEKGMIEIQMNGGSIVHVEAPAEIRLENDNQVFLIQGKLTANVPRQAVGFIVRTPSASVVDYGTEFGILVDQYANTEAHVLKGKVEMRLGSDTRVFDKALRLVANQAGRVSGQSLTQIPAAPNQFTYGIPSAFENNVMSLNPLLYFRLKENDIHTFGEITGKPGLKIDIPSDMPLAAGPSLGSNKLSCALKMNGADGFSVGNVFQACQFETGDYTVAAWVRFDKIQKQVIWCNRVIGNASVPGDKEEGVYYRVLWLNDEGRLEHTAYFPEKDGQDRNVNTIVSPAALEANKWYFVAVTHAMKKYKLMYINGELIAQSPSTQGGLLEKYTDLTIGRAFEGLAPGLAGATSEILFFSRDLTEQEIKKLYLSATQN